LSRPVARSYAGSGISKTCRGQFAVVHGKEWLICPGSRNQLRKR